MARKKDGLTRREFLATAGAAAVGSTFLPRFLMAEEEAVEAMINAGGMPLSKLGKTGEKVSALGFGGGGTVAKAPRLLPSAIQKGVTYIDTAEGYDNGNSEREIGKYLATVDTRKDLFIVTKTGDHDPAKLEEHLDGSLERLQTDYVDVLYLHNLGDPERLDGEMMAAAEALKKSGKTRLFGLSSHHEQMIPVLGKAAEVGFIDMLMMKYNFRDYGDADLNAALDKCHEAEVGLVAMKTGAGAVPDFAEFEKEGLSKQVVSLKATLADPRIAVVVSKMANMEQVTQNSTAAKEQKLSRAEWELLERYAQATNHLYCRGCQSVCGPACGGIAVADILRYKMYHDGYGEVAEARELYAALPAERKAIAGVDFAKAERACPQGIAIASALADADSTLS